MGLSDRLDDLDQRTIMRTSIGFAQRNVQEWAKSVCVPTFLYQVHDDVLTHPSNVQTIFDNIPSQNYRCLMTSAGRTPHSRSRSIGMTSQLNMSHAEVARWLRFGSFCDHLCTSGEATIMTNSVDIIAVIMG
jgi:hypothetical protein